jgi:hypothetical protein
MTRYFASGGSPEDMGIGELLITPSEDESTLPVSNMDRHWPNYVWYQDVNGTRRCACHDTLKARSLPIIGHHAVADALVRRTHCPIMNAASKQITGR